jgi:hydrogenase nickel incorporation protein HypA/HybF
MHELALSTAILETVMRHAKGRRVTQVDMTIGTMRQVVPDSLDFYFGVVTKGTLAEGAKLEQEIVAAELRCRDCSRQWNPDPEFPDFRCPGCSTANVQVLAGTEFEVESINVQEPKTENAPRREEAECIAPR